MKTFVIVVLAGAICVCATYLFVSKSLATRHAAELVDRQAEWDTEKAELENAIENAKQKQQSALREPAHEAATPAAATAPTKSSAEQLIARLRTLKGQAQVRSTRQAIHDFEELLALGNSAVPAIREFLRSNEEFEFAALKGNQAPAEFVVPPTMRFGLFDVLKQIGGPDAERVLAEVMNSTMRGSEMSWLSRALEELSPGTYRDAALASAKRLLQTPEVPDGRTNDRDQAYKILMMFNDASYASTAQSQLIRVDGQVDKPALNYLTQTLGPQSVALAAQLYDDPRFASSQNKEPLARVALNYAGADANANAFYVKAVNDFSLSNEARKNLIEDLNQDGFANRKNLTANDLPLINSRMALIEQLVPSTTDQVNLAAMKEAYKDLVNMRERITNPQKSVK